MDNDVVIEGRAAAVLAALVVALWVKGLIVSGVQVGARVRGRAFARTEDAAMMGRTPQAEPALAARAADAWRNETENGPVFLAIAAAAVLTGVSGARWPSPAWPSCWRASFMPGRRSPPFNR